MPDAHRKAQLSEHPFPGPSSDHTVSERKETGANPEMCQEQSLVLSMSNNQIWTPRSKPCSPTGLYDGALVDRTLSVSHPWGGCMTQDFFANFKTSMFFSRLEASASSAGRMQQQ
jgi:hypothetical protein